MPIKYRAISAEQKKERRRAILEAAGAMFLEKCYEDISVKQVAERIGVTKATIYLYYKTKERLFLALYAGKANAMFEELIHGIGSAKPPLTTTSLINLIMGILTKHPLFLKLTGILHTVLEKSIHPNTDFEIKKKLRKQMLKAGALLEEALPWFPKDQGARFFFRLHGLIIGCQHVSKPSPAMERLLEHPEMKFFQVDLRQELHDLLTLLLKGMEKQN